MSRLAKKPIAIPEGVSVEARDNFLFVKGPKGELKKSYHEDIVFEILKDEVFVRTPRETKQANALSGTFASHLKNMIKGVTEGYKKKLKIEGVGFRAELKGTDLVLSLGLSHPVIFKASEGIQFSVEKNIITVSGINKELVGNEAAHIRASKKPEPYKGKGIHYIGEVVRRKAGKKVGAVA